MLQVANVSENLAASVTLRSFGILLQHYTVSQSKAKFHRREYLKSRNLYFDISNFLPHKTSATCFKWIISI